MTEGLKPQVTTKLSAQGLVAYFVDGKWKVFAKQLFWMAVREGWAAFTNAIGQILIKTSNNFRDSDISRASGSSSAAPSVFSDSYRPDPTYRGSSIPPSPPPPYSPPPGPRESGFPGFNT